PIARNDVIPAVWNEPEPERVMLPLLWMVIGEPPVVCIVPLLINALLLTFIVIPEFEESVTPAEIVIEALPFLLSLLALTMTGPPLRYNVVLPVMAVVEKVTGRLSSGIAGSSGWNFEGLKRIAPPPLDSFTQEPIGSVTVTGVPKFPGNSMA